VGVLCDPSHRNGACLIARQLLHAFRARFAHLLPAMEAEHAREITDMLGSYTFASATQQASAAALTLPPFADFQRDVVQPLLLHPPLTAALLVPLLASHAGSLRAFLLETRPPQKSRLAPTPMTDDPAVTSGRQPELAVLLSACPDGPMAPLAAWAGPHMAPVWAAVTAHAQRHFSGQTPSLDAGSPGEETVATPPGAATHSQACGCLSLAFPACTDPRSGLSLHAAVRPLQQLPHAGGYVLLFYGCEYDTACCQCKRDTSGSCTSCGPPAVSSAAAALHRASTVATPADVPGAPHCVSLAQTPPEVGSALQDVAGVVRRCFLVTTDPRLSGGAAEGVPGLVSPRTRRTGVGKAGSVESAGAVVDSVGKEGSRGDGGVRLGTANGVERAGAKARAASAAGEAPIRGVNGGRAGVNGALAELALAGHPAGACGAAGDAARHPGAAAVVVSARSAPFDLVIETPRLESGLAVSATTMGVPAAGMAVGGDRVPAVALDGEDARVR
jgi:hypothetical protein